MKFCVLTILLVCAICPLVLGQSANLTPVTSVGAITCVGGLCTDKSNARYSQVVSQWTALSIAWQIGRASTQLTPKQIVAAIQEASTQYHRTYIFIHAKRRLDTPAQIAQVKKEDDANLATYEATLAPLITQGKTFRAKLVAAKRAKEDDRWDEMLSNARPSQLADSGFALYLERVASR